MRSSREEMYSKYRGGPKIKTCRTINTQQTDRGEGPGKTGIYPGLYILITVGLIRNLNMVAPIFTSWNLLKLLYGLHD